MSDQERHEIRMKSLNSLLDMINERKEILAATVHDRNDAIHLRALNQQMQALTAHVKRLFA